MSSDRVVLLALMVFGLASAAAPTVLDASADGAASRFLQLPSLTLTDRGARGAWSPDMPVTLRWRQRHLAGTKVHVEISRDRGSTWGEIGLAHAERGEFTWIVHGRPGPGLVRLTSEDSRTRSRTRRVVFAPPIRDISFALSFGLALHEDGRVRVWGSLNDAPLHGLHGGLVARPTVFRQFSHVVAIHAGGITAAVVRDDGSAWLWRPRESGELVRIVGVENAIWVRTHYRATFVRVGDGRVFGVGTSDEGADSHSTAMAIEVPELRDVVDIQLGDDHGLALRPDGTVLAFGSNGFGQLGDGTGVSHADPAPVPGLEGVVAIAARLDTSLALTRDGAVFVWGPTNYLIPESENFGNALTPYAVPGLERITAIGCGEGSVYALRDDGVVLAWGANGSGELGDGTYENRTLPSECLVGDVRRMFVGEGCVHVLTTSGVRLGWGGRQFHQVGDGSSVNQLIPVPIYSR